MQPIGPRVLVEPVEVTESTEGNIVLPPGTADPAQVGMVLSISQRDDGDKPRRGDFVIYAKHAGTKTDGGLLLEREDVLAVIEIDHEET